MVIKKREDKEPVFLGGLENTPAQNAQAALTPAPAVVGLQSLLAGLTRTSQSDYLSNIPDDAEFVQTTKYIDKHTTRRERKLVTPTVCRVCGFNIEDAIKRSYDELNAQEKLLIPQILDEHNRVSHPASTKQIITGAEFKKMYAEQKKQEQ